MVVAWATNQLQERYDIAPEIQRHFALEAIEADVRGELAADPLATREQIITRVGEQMKRHNRPD